LSLHQLVSITHNTHYTGWICAGPAITPTRPDIDASKTSADGTEPPQCGVGLVLAPGPAADDGTEWVAAALRPSGPADASGAVLLGDCVVSINGYPIQASSPINPRCIIKGEFAAAYLNFKLN